MTGIGNGMVRYEDDDPSITYVGPWTRKTGAANFSGQNYHRAMNTVSHCDISFNASQIVVRADSWYNHYRFFCYLVDMPDEEWEWFNQSVGDSTQPIRYNLTVCGVSGLSNGAHTLRLGMVAGDASILDIDSYVLYFASIPGTKPIWWSDFPSVAPPVGFENTTFKLPTSPTSATTSTSAPLSSANDSTHSGASKKKNSAALGAGVGVGTVVILFVVGLLFYWFWWRKRTSSKTTLAGGESGKDPQLFGYQQGTTNSSESLSKYSPTRIDSGNDIVGVAPRRTTKISVGSVGRYSTMNFPARVSNIPGLHTSMSYDSRPAAGVLSTDLSPTTPPSERTLPPLTILEDVEGLGSTVAYASTVSSGQYAPRVGTRLESPSSFTPRF